MTRNIALMATILVTAMCTISHAQQNSDRGIRKDNEKAVQVGSDDLFETLKSYEFGQDSTVLASIDQEIRSADAAKRAEIEGRLLDILQSPAATDSAKDFACRMLQWTGSMRSVPILKALLDHEKLSEPALFTMTVLPYPEVDTILVEALARAGSVQKVCLINSIAQRRIEEAVPKLTRLVASDDKAIAHAAVVALGRLGTLEAAAALADAEAAAPLGTARDEACLECADRLLDAGNNAEAVSIYERLSGDDHPTMIRIAAFHGLITGDKAYALSVILDMLKDEDAALQQAAASFIAELPDLFDPEALAESIRMLPPAGQVAVLTALADLGDQAAAPVVVECTASESPAVRIASYRALGVVGGPSDVALLAEAAAFEDLEGEAAAAALNRLSGAEINTAMLACLRDHQIPVRIALVRSLGARDAREAYLTLIKTMNDQDPQLRGESLNALKILSNEQDLPVLLELLKNYQASDIRKGLEEIITEVCRYLDDIEPSVKLLTDTLDESSASTQVCLIHILGDLPCAQTLAPVTAALDNKNIAVQNAAITALGNWPNEEPTQSLLGLADSATDPEQCKLILCGLLNMADLPGNRTDEKSRKLYEAASVHAHDTAGKERIIAGVSNVYHFWVPDFLEPFLNEPPTQAAAQEALQKVSAALSKTVSNDAVGCPVTLVSQPNKSYCSDNGLADNVYGSENFRDGAWQGFNGDDLDATIDLGSAVEIRSIRIGFLTETRSWIFLPVEVKFFVSEDGNDYRCVASYQRAVPNEMEETRIDEMIARIEPAKARYVRIHARNAGVCPAWHPGNGKGAWMFADEIQINPHLPK